LAKIEGNKTGASRQGHHFHEAWMARRSLGLLIPRDDLYCITIEGLSVIDEEDAGQDAAEIADATFYYGRGTQFATCERMEITQFKYSVANDDKSFTFSSAKKTIEKFWTTERKLSASHGHATVEAKLKFIITTNRPISESLCDALCAISNETEPKATSKAQYDQILELLGVSPEAASRFAKRITLQGAVDDLTATSAYNARTIVDWTATNDVLAHARLGELRHLIRSKSESTKKGGNAVFQKDILGCLGIGHIDELLPCHDAFPEVGTVLRRRQLDDFLAVVSSSEKRWVITAPSGNGKTVFLQSLVNELSSKNRVVLFDCFGGSAYRSPADGRHRPERGLMHIVNDLSFGGLCDPILPNSSDPSAVIRASINRFKQAIATLRTHSPTSQLIIIIDAIDNAAVEAKYRAQPCFPRELLEALTHGGHPDGLVLISTSRPERLQVSVGRATFKTFHLQGFTPSEITEFVRARIQTATSGQIAILSNRSEGNPRVLATLLEDDPKLESILKRSDKVVLESLIEERLNKAAAFTRSKGATDDMVQAFLCALCRLPPPIPIGELASAFGIEPAEAESFAADLSPLLQRTRFGLIFKDEPTETLVRNLYGEELHLLDKVANQLFVRQTKSIYASKALPSLLFAMGRVESLRELALSNHFPAELDSEIARHEIRLNRINAGLGAAAQSNNFDAVVDLLVEKSSVVATDERGESYLCDHPDLVVALGDSEMLRRVSKSNEGWFGLTRKKWRDF
jgi:NACHT domain